MGRSQQGRANSKTVFPIGPASKAFIATAILQLCGDGKLNLDTPITEYLPTFSLYTEERTKELTLRDALCHRSGLTRHDLTLFTNEDTPLAEMVYNMRYLEPAFPPRTRFCYQNHMFALASQLVEETTGMLWGEYVEQHILNKLGMSHSYTCFQEYEQKEHNYAKPKLRVGSLNIPTKNMRCDSTGGAGAMSSCAEDMLHWAQTNLYEGIYDSEVVFEKKAAEELHGQQMPIHLGEMFSYQLKEVTDISYGFGLFVESFRGEKYVYHGGTISGFKSEIGFMPTQDFAFCV